MIHELNSANIPMIYYYLAIFSTIVFAVKLILFNMGIGGDSEVCADFNSEVDTDTSFNFLSVQSILAFLMGFGWAGFAAMKQFGIHTLKAFIFAFIVGFCFMALNVGLMFLMKKLEKTVKKDKKTALNKTGRAYTNILAKSQGQAEIEINGQLSVVSVMNNTDIDINAFEPIKVVKVENEILYVEKLVR